MPAPNRLAVPFLRVVRISTPRSIVTTSRAYPRYAPCLSICSARPLRRANARTQSGTRVRWQSQDSNITGRDGVESSKRYTFDDIKSFIATPSKDRVLIDTREPAELQQTGRIPGAISIPITSQPDSFFITDEAFEDRYGFERPGKDKEVVFYCKAGVRSKAAAGLARQCGWGKVGEYSGSWLDWERNGGAVERP